MEQLILQHYDNIFTYLYRRTGDRALAEDLAQEVFLRVVKALPAYHPTGKFSNFVFTIAVNVSNDYYRRNKRPSCGGNEPVRADTGAGPEETFLLREREGRLKQAILTLPEAQRDAILLRYFHNAKVREIARITGANPSTVKSRLSQGLNKLKHLLTEEESI